jgi:predicted NBD/HSP70 family sugar kinase
MADPLTLAEVRVHVTQRIREYHLKETGWRHIGADRAAESLRAKAEELTEVIAMIDRAQEGDADSLPTLDKRIERLERVLVTLQEVLQAHVIAKPHYDAEHEAKIRMLRDWSDAIRQDVAKIDQKERALR